MWSRVSAVPSVATAHGTPHWWHISVSAALREQRRLGRVDVLHLALGQGAGAEGDDPPLHVRDGEHHAVAEAVVVPIAALPRHHEARGHQLLVRVASGPRGPAKSVPRLRGAADAPGVERLLREAALRHVLPRLRPLGRLPELLGEEASRPGMHLVEAALHLLARPGHATAALEPLGHRHPHRPRHDTHRLQEVHPLVLAHEAEHVPSLAAPEALEHLPLGVDDERGGFFGVERAARLEGLPRLLQRDVAGHNIHNVRGPLDLGYDIIGDTCRQSALAPCHPSALRERPHRHLARPSRAQSPRGDAT